MTSKYFIPNSKSSHNSAILYKLKRFLELKQSIYGSTHKREIKWLKSSGHCHGYAVLWSVYNLFGNPDDFYRILASLAQWRPKRNGDHFISSSSQMLKYTDQFLYPGSVSFKQIDEFLTQLIYLQNPARINSHKNQDELKSILQIKYLDRLLEPTRELQCSGRISHDSLARLIRKVAKPNRVITIGLGNSVIPNHFHTVALINKNNNLYYFDANMHIFNFPDHTLNYCETPLSIKQVIELIVYSARRLNVSSDQLNLEFNVYTFDPSKQIKYNLAELYSKYFSSPVIARILNYSSVLAQRINSSFKKVITNSKDIRFRLEFNDTIHQQSINMENSTIAACLQYNSSILTSYLNVKHDDLQLPEEEMSMDKSAFKFI